jgi:hypothetical protein
MRENDFPFDEENVERRQEIERFLKHKGRIRSWYASRDQLSAYRQSLDISRSTARHGHASL